MIEFYNYLAKMLTMISDFKLALWACTFVTFVYYHFVDTLKAAFMRQQVRQLQEYNESLNIYHPLKWLPTAQLCFMLCGLLGVYIFETLRFALISCLQLSSNTSIYTIFLFTFCSCLLWYKYVSTSHMFVPSSKPVMYFLFVNVFNFILNVLAIYKQSFAANVYIHFVSIYSNVFVWWVQQASNE